MNSISRHAARTWRRAISCLAFAGAALAAGTACADPVIVGSVDPQSMRVTIFEDLLVKRFADGSAISRLYGKYDSISNGFQFLRVGKLATAARDCGSSSRRRAASCGAPWRRVISSTSRWTWATLTRTGTSTWRSETFKTWPARFNPG